MTDLDNKKTVKSSRDEYLNFWSDANYYTGAVLMFTHPVVMFFLYDAWANYSYLMLGYSLQLYFTGAYCWAASDEKYEYWAKKHVVMYYVFSGLNYLFGVAMLVGGNLLYFFTYGIYGFMGVGLVIFFILV